jgi:hypothetical protein
MHQVSNPAHSSRCRRVPTNVLSAQFMFGVDVLIVNAAIPTIAAELRASPALIEAVIARSIDRRCHAGGYRRPHQKCVHHRRVWRYRHIVVMRAGAACFSSWVLRRLSPAEFVAAPSVRSSSQLTRRMRRI